MNKIGQLFQNSGYAAKGTDFYHPLQPLQLPRGYGGVAVIWRTEINSIVKPLTDGNERMQCVELDLENGDKLLCISTYLPSRGKNTSTDEYLECLDILWEICTTYQSTHSIIVAGDLNENIDTNPIDKRAIKLKTFIEHFGFQYSNSGKTFVSPQGIDCTEIDYFLVSSRGFSYTEKTVLSEFVENTSDHHPISMSIVIPSNDRNRKTEVKVSKLGTSRIPWDKVDINKYEQCVSKLIQNDVQEVETPNDTFEGLVKALTVAAKEVAPKRTSRKSCPTLKVWNAEISLNLRNMRVSIRNWAEHGKPNEENHPACVSRKNCKKLFRSSIRKEHARRDANDRLKIINARSGNSKVFHSLVNKQRKRSQNFIDDLNVAKDLYTGENVIHGFRQHFECLAKESDNELFDPAFHSQVKFEVDCIQELVDMKPVDPVTMVELDEAIKNINKGKSADINKLTIEHVMNAGPHFRVKLLKFVNSIFASGEIPSSLKIGLLSPIYKNKGSASEASNYRGITILPVFEKIVEFILKQRIIGSIEKSQSVYQRGFTKKTSPLHASLIVEEVTRECRDKGEHCDLVFLDAKAAFDVVNHEHLLRRLYYAGVDDKHWSLIRSLHSNSTSVIKWANNKSEPFAVHQGVKQGGIASADLYKVYVNPLLKRLEACNWGIYVGDINCCASACADDVTVNSIDHFETQLLINIAEDFANSERYTLQPKKTEALLFCGKRTANNINRPDFNLYGSNITNVEVATHLGVKRGNTLSSTADNQIQNNIEKARRTTYSLMASGLHGTNGLDPETSIHLLNIYVLPILLYGLEIVSLNKTQILQLERFNKKLLKQVLSLPTNTSDAAVYMISGFLPIEAVIHKRVLTLFNNVCLQSEHSIEKRLARRQLSVKTLDSNSWFVHVRKLLLKYSLPDPDEILGGIPKNNWKRQVNQKVNQHWESVVLDAASVAKTLKFLTHFYKPGKPHPIIRIPVRSSRCLNRIPIKLKLLTSTYILQSTRVAFNQNEVDPTCKLCFDESETVDHFLLNCAVLKPQREVCFPEISQVLRDTHNIDFDKLPQTRKLRVLLDCSFFIDKNPEEFQELEYLCRRYLYNIHCIRYKSLFAVVQRKKHRV